MMMGFLAAHFVEVLEGHHEKVADNPVVKKFKCLVSEDKFEEILSYNKVMQHIEKIDNDEETFTNECIIPGLTEDYKLKLKGTGLIEFHLGCNLFCDKEGVSCFAPSKYINKLIASHVSMFGLKPRTNKTTSKW
jgi:hypothetical protein